VFVLRQRGGRMTVIDDQDPIQELASDAADEASAMAFARGARTGVLITSIGRIEHRVDGHAVQVRVARGQFGPGGGDTDHRPAVEQLAGTPGCASRTGSRPARKNTPIEVTGNGRHRVQACTVCGNIAAGRVLEWPREPVQAAHGRPGESRYPVVSR